MEYLPYDILNNIIQYVDIEASRNMIISSVNIYNYKDMLTNRMIDKITSYFSSLDKLNFKEQLVDKNKLYIHLNKIYNHFKKHKHACLSDILIYLCDIKYTKEWIFKYIISKCHFSKARANNSVLDTRARFPQISDVGNIEMQEIDIYRLQSILGNVVDYNAIRADDLIYILMFCEDVSIVMKNIYVEEIILLHVIKYRISIKDRDNVVVLLNYLLYKHFFRYSEYIEDVLVDIMCEVIKYNDIVLLEEIYNKQKMYKFTLRYQKIVNACLKRGNIQLLQFINDKMVKQNKELRGDMKIECIIITTDDIKGLMRNKLYSMLCKVIELYLGNTINMSGYMREIMNNFECNNNECMAILDYLNDVNKKLIMEKLIKR